LFATRGRLTTFPRDWSSDVRSSDLEEGHVEPGAQDRGARGAVLPGGLSRARAGQRRGPGDEDGGRGDDGPTACGHTEIDAVQGGGTPMRLGWDPHRMSTPAPGRQRSADTSLLRGGLADPFDYGGTAVPRRPSAYAPAGERQAAHGYAPEPARLAHRLADDAAVQGDP